ncbi:hypothetical protein EBZ37_11740, partial [bacterium]|nr:hypothetical protein [bacterium]
ELRSILPNGSTTNRSRIQLHQKGLTQAHSPTFSPDGKSLAFVGINSKGWQNLYVLEKKGEIRQVTQGFSAWKNPSWTPQGILVSSDQIDGTDLYGVYLVDPESGRSQFIVSPELTHDNLLEATSIDPHHEIFLRSSNGSGQQIYRWRPQTGLQKITFAKTQLLQPTIIKGKKNNELYSLGLEKGRYRLVEIPEEVWLDGKAPSISTKLPRHSWSPPSPALAVTPFPRSEIQTYKSFKGTGVRIEDLAAFFSSGSIFGLAGTVSDLMRDYIVSAEVLSLGGSGVNNASLFVTSERGRSTWTLGAYTTRQTRLDALFDDDVTRVYDYREYGLLAGLQYPVGAYQYITATLRVGGARRDNFSDGALVESWNSVNPGTELMFSPSIGFGFDQIQYELYTGPIRGFGFLLEAQTEYFPGRSYASERLRLDIAQYEQLWGRTLLAIHGLAGTSFNLTDGTDFRNPFLVSNQSIQELT